MRFGRKHQTSKNRSVYGTLPGKEFFFGRSEWRALFDRQHHAIMRGDMFAGAQLTKPGFDNRRKAKPPVERNGWTIGRRVEVE